MKSKRPPIKVSLEDFDGEPNQEMINRRVGSTLRRLRKTRKLTLNQIADQIGVSQGFMSIVEKGKNGCRLELLFQVCKLHNLTLSQFFAEVEL